jgi:hypothetical protein
METSNLSILVLKLSSGEVVISKVQEDQTGNMALIKPYEFLSKTDAKGNVTGGFLPFMPLALDGFIQLVQRPVAVATPDEQSANTYMKLIGDKVIETPPKNLIIPK